MAFAFEVAGGEDDMRWGELFPVLEEIPNIGQQKVVDLRVCVAGGGGYCAVDVSEVKSAAAGAGAASASPGTVNPLTSFAAPNRGRNT